MRIESFIETLGADFFVGVPDSQLKPLCNYLMDVYGIDEQHHIIAANEGNCTAIAAGYYLSTGKVPVVYMQNSGEGNIINPVASLLNENVYAIPEIFVIGWRGEPGVHDEPQHIYQGKVTLRLLEDMQINYFVIENGTTEQQFKAAMDKMQADLTEGKSVAIVVRKNALEYSGKRIYRNDYHLLREEIIQHIVEVSKEDPIICTTGKASRELFETRVKKQQSHQMDFLTVGSMGHASSIALGVAVHKPDKKIWCVDGDGAVLMHMGAMALIGNIKPHNLIHVVINNGAHETVGGMPTVAESIDLTNIARACGYSYTVSVSDMEALDMVLNKAKERNELCFIEVKSAIGAREDLGRPTTTARENKDYFIKFLSD